ncbi:MAG TPA: T9SS type A sorting domain-containing protein, partial [Bacteroidota bacterium]|nr:T9SS type A sorting domain-containing protein [Bacteroidota bacterium]
VGYPGDARPVIASVKDIGNDQGGSVSLTWMPSYIDEWPSTTITEYAIYRGVGLNSALPSSAGFTPAGKSRVKIDGESERGASSFLAPLTAGGTDTIFWQNIGSVGAEWLGGYLFNAQTPSDSGAGGNPVSYFMVRARTSSPAVFWSSAPDSGYSVDNLPPSIVTGLVAELEPGPAVSLAWDKNSSDTDFGSYEVYRSPAGGVTISGIKIGETTDTTFTDASPVIGLVNSYYVIAVDIHGNKGAPSVEAGVPVGITVQYSVMDKWNMISVPLTVADYSATVLYSAAVSNVYAFEGAYTVKSTLTNGQGYWVKFNGSQNVGLTGLLRESDSLQVQAGWNLIGSVSGSVPTATIASTPSGIVTSQFFAYNGSYAPSSTIDAGKGYWVKATQSGTLYLSSAQNTPVASRIRIVPTDDTPPSPPDADDGRMVPAEYLLEQNYPNPFNPFTEIRYGIPEDMNVRLDVFNPLGELVATLVHRDVPAGFHVQGWEASDLPSGVYLLRLTAGSFRGTKKMVLLR